MKDVVCIREKLMNKGIREGDFEELVEVPDWEKASWEVRLRGVDGRYPSLNLGGPIVDGGVAGVGRRLMEQRRGRVQSFGSGVGLGVSGLEEEGNLGDDSGGGQRQMAVNDCTTDQVYHTATTATTTKTSVVPDIISASQMPPTLPHPIPPTPLMRNHSLLVRAGSRRDKERNPFDEVGPSMSKSSGQPRKSVYGGMKE